MNMRERERGGGRKVSECESGERQGKREGQCEKEIKGDKGRERVRKRAK